MLSNPWWVSKVGFDSRITTIVIEFMSRGSDIKLPRFALWCNGSTGGSFVQ